MERNKKENQNKNQNGDNNEKKTKNKKLLILSILLILLIVILLLLIRFVVKYNSKTDYIVVYLNSEFDENMIEELEDIKNVKDAYYMSNEDIYNYYNERIKGVDFSFLFNQDNFSDVIIIDVKQNTDRSILDEINNKGFSTRSIYTEDAYESMLMDLCGFMIYLEPDASEEELNEVYDFVCSIEGAYEVRKVTKEDALNIMKERLGDNQDILEGYEENNPFPASVTFKISDIGLLDDVNKKVEEYMNENDFTDEYNNSNETLKALVDAMEEADEENNN